MNQPRHTKDSKRTIMKLYEMLFSLENYFTNLLKLEGSQGLYRCPQNAEQVPEFARWCGDVDVLLDACIEYTQSDRVDPV